MKAEELILRFWALSDRYEIYRKPLAGFINSYAEENRHLSDAQKDNLRHSFMSTLAQVRQVFGGLAFKIYDENGFVDSKFNSALFDAEMIAAHQITSDPNGEFKASKVISDGLVTLLKSNENFRKSISIATSDEGQLRIRVNAMKALFSA
jgi:hypothetical protein